MDRLSPDAFSVVICAYTEDRWNHTVAAVKSVQAQSTPPGEIVLVIDHNPRLLSRAQLAFRDIHIVPNRLRRGLSGGRNTGIELAKGAVVAFLDDDAIAQPGWLEQLANGYTSGNVLGVGGRASPRWSAAGRPTWFPDEFDWVVGCSYRGMPTRRSPIRNLMGCNMSVRTDVLREVGGFVDDFGRGFTDRLVSCDETELCIRASRLFAEGRFIYEPGAHVTHHVPSERTTWSYFRTRCRAEGFSKGLLTKRLGNAEGLKSERSYAWRTLPIGFARGLKRGLTDRNTGELKRAAAIVAGLTLTTAGYIEGRVVCSDVREGST